MSSLLMEDRPIMFLPMLAKALGSCERAVVLQQIHWLSRQPNSGTWEEGAHWVWGTYEDWCRDYFTMWSPHTLKKHIQKLEKMGVLISAKLRAHEHDQTKFYRVNYTHELLRDSTGMRPHPVSSNEPHPVASKRPRAVRSNEPEAAPSIYRTKTSTEKAAKKVAPPTRAQRKRTNPTPAPPKKGSYKPPRDIDPLGR